MNNKIFEIKVDEYFDSYYGNELINCLLSNGYVLTLTPTKYGRDRYAIMVEVGDVDESFQDKDIFAELLKTDRFKTK